MIDMENYIKVGSRTVEDVIQFRTDIFHSIITHRNENIIYDILKSAYDNP